MSAFDWRKRLLCNDGDGRRPTHGRAYKDPLHTCDAGRGKEQQILQRQYNFSAEALVRGVFPSCGTPATTNGSRASAVSVLKAIRHMTPLSEHLGSSSGSGGGNGVGSSGGGLEALARRGVKVFATVLEPGFDFEAMATAAVQRLLADLPSRVTFPAAAPPPSGVVVGDGESDAYAHVTPAQLQVGHLRKSVLSSVAEKCVAEFYGEDYRTIAALRDISCPLAGDAEKDCRAALQSILNRRGAPLLITQ